MPGSKLLKFLVFFQVRKDRVVSNPPMFHLYTGLKSATIDDPVENWERWKRLGVRYLARVPLKGNPIPPPSYMNEGRFNMIYQSKGNLKLRVVDLGPAATRKPWSAFDPKNERKLETFN